VYILWHGLLYYFSEGGMRCAFPPYAKRYAIYNKITYMLLQKIPGRKIPYTFEEMSASHCRAVIDIFNYFVTASHAALLGEPVAYSFFHQFLKLAHGYPALVVKAGPGPVVGFGFLRPHYIAGSRQKAAQVTYFILPAYTRQGLGTALLDFFVDEARKMSLDLLLASISSRNRESLGFHRKHGFREFARFPKAGRKFGEDYDVLWLQKQLE
jgi:L-amino acid N-acyltransferase YncA